MIRRVLLIVAMLSLTTLGETAQSYKLRDVEAAASRVTDVLLFLGPLDLPDQDDTTGQPLSGASELSETQLKCVRNESTKEAYRRRKLNEVKAYALANPQRFSAEHDFLVASFDLLLQKEKAARTAGQKADRGNLRIFAPLFDDPQYRSLRALVGLSRVELTIVTKPPSDVRDIEERYRASFLRVNAVAAACHLPIPEFVTETLKYTQGLANSDALAQEFGRACNGEMAMSEDFANKLAVPPTVDESKLRLKPVYPSMARRSGLEGTAMVTLLINENGEAMRGSVSESSGSIMLDSSALEASRDWRFIPARVNGAARERCRVVVSWV